MSDESRDVLPKQDIGLLLHNVLLGEDITKLITHHL